MGVATATNAFDRARAAVEAAICADRAIANRIRRWPRPEEDIPPDLDPSPRDLPALRVEVGPGSGSPRRTAIGGAILRPASLVVRVWSGDTTGAEARGLCDRLLDALDPADEDRRDALDGRWEAAGIWSLRSTNPGLPPPGSAGRPVLVTTATFDLILWDEP